MIPQHLRYSPVNGMIVQWGHGARSFSACGLPKPLYTHEQPQSAEACCENVKQLPDAIEWAGWGRWLPEIGLGIQDFDEDIAAAYVREAAIDFAQLTQALQRSVFLRVEKNVYSYPLIANDHERIIGVMAIMDGDYRIHTGASKRQNLTAVVKHGSDEVLLPPALVQSACGYCARKEPYLELLVWSAPTEYACAHDVLLYNNHRRLITASARARYVSVLHYDNAALMRSVMSHAQFRAECRNIRGQVTAWIDTINGKRNGGARVFR